MKVEKREKTQHTPTPLALTEEKLRQALNNAGGRLQQHENYIVRAVNSHGELLEAAKTMRKLLVDMETENDRWLNLDEWDKTIAQAEGK